MSARKLKKSLGGRGRGLLELLALSAIPLAGCASRSKRKAAAKGCAAPSAPSTAEGVPIPEETPKQIDFLVAMGGFPDLQKADRVHRALGELTWYSAISKVSTRVMAGPDQVRPTCISLPPFLSHSIVPNTLPPQQIISSSL